MGVNIRNLSIETLRISREQHPASGSASSVDQKIQHHIIEVPIKFLKKREKTIDIFRIHAIIQKSSGTGHKHMGV
jgi:hypothetical protein